MMSLLKLFSNRTKSSEVPEVELNRPNQVKNQFVINNPVGVLNLGPTYNINVGQAFTEINAKNVTKTKRYKQTGKDKKTEATLDKNIPTKESLRTVCSSRRRLEYSDILKLTKTIGPNWKAVGLKFQDGLKFDSAQMDQFEQDTDSQSDAVRRMLYRWLQWKDKKATVGKLALALFEATEFEALDCLTP